MPDPEPARVLCVFETMWDRKQLRACDPAALPALEVIFPEPADEDCRADLDVHAYIDAAVRGDLGRVDGVVTSSDYPGAAVAASIAARLGLAGPSPRSVLRAAHKWVARLAQREAVPEAVPPFALLDPRAADLRPGIPLPCFVKPVKGSFSLFARRVDTQTELEALLRSDGVQEFSEHYVRIFDRLARELAGIDVDAGSFIAEGLLRGAMVTVEGFVARGQVVILGVVDSVLHPGTSSFARFEYPSALPDDVQKRMGEIAERAVRALGLDATLFNAEMMWDRESDAIAIVEVNPRMCGQFGDLYQKVDGTHGYEIALALALGRQPRPRVREGRHAIACSQPLRVFEGARLERAPSAADVAAVEAEHPGAQVWIECSSGQEFGDFSWEDGSSQRYAVLNYGADDRADLARRGRALQARLGFRWSRDRAAAGCRSS
jgi:biotin carboxylase